MNKYEAWIAAHPCTDALRGRGKCSPRTNAMVKQFPELRRAAGYYHDAQWGKQQHWWCVDPDGTVVDPTASQFPTQGSGWYEELAPTDRPVGRCMDCGEDTFNTYVDDNGITQPNTSAPTFCNPTCENATLDYLNAPRRNIL